MSKALIPGSFDPITNGHLDIITRASKLFDEVIVLVSKNSAKNYMLCSNKRLTLVQDAIKNITNVTTCAYDGLLVDFAYENNIDITVKGIRNQNDFAYEQQMAKTNMFLSQKKYNRDFETLFLPASKDYSDVSSTAVRLLLQSNSDISDIVPNANLLIDILKN